MPIYDIDSFPVTEAMINDYCKSLANKGLAFSTLTLYVRSVQGLYDFLPSPKCVNEEQLSCWVSSLARRGLAQSTINGYLAGANGLLKYLQQTKILRDKEQADAHVQFPSRENYFRLLRQAKMSGRYRAYLLIKTIVTIGVKPAELSGITVEVLKEGVAVVTSHSIQRRVQIPEPIRLELLNYAAEQGIETGTLFITKDGDPLVHSLVWKEIKRVCREANLAEEMGTPKSLRHLYRETYRYYCGKNLSKDADKEYEKLLLEEESSIGWNI